MVLSELAPLGRENEDLGIRETYSDYSPASRVSAKDSPGNFPQRILPCFSPSGRPAPACRVRSPKIKGGRAGEIEAISPSSLHLAPPAVRGGASALRSRASEALI